MRLKILPFRRAMRLLLLLSLACATASEPVRWSDAVVRLERKPSGSDAAQFTCAIRVGPTLLAAMLEPPATGDTWRAVAHDRAAPVKLLARDAESGFSLLSLPEKNAPAWPVVPLNALSPVPSAGASLTLQSAAPAPSRAAGADMLHDGKLLPTPWLRVHLPAGAWVPGTPITHADGTLAGLLAGGVPGVPEAARMFPADAVRHFTLLWHRRQSLARAELGLSITHASGIPRVEQCYAALPAERAGIQPGDVLLRIGTTEIPDSTAAARACFFLCMDEPVKLALLRGTETVEVSVTPEKGMQKAK